MKIGIELEYVFSIQATLDTRVVGDVPGGVRVDVGYQDGWVTVDPAVGSSVAKEVRTTRDAPDGRPTLGRISSGQDWILIGKVDEIAFADFDGRLTFKFNANLPVGEASERRDPVVPLVAGGHVRGRVNLGVRYDEWLLGRLETTLPLILPLSFDVSAFDDKKTSPDEGKRALAKTPIAELGRSLFWGIGTATVKRERYSPLTAVNLRVCRVTTEAVQTAVKTADATAVEAAKSAAEAAERIAAEEAAKRLARDGAQPGGGR
jgi:hypothetical protein